MTPETPASDPPEILIVDDMLPNLRLLEEMLTSHGYRVREATNGAQALEQTAAARPDLILLDIRLPGMNGFEVCRRLKAEEATRSIPVIFVSALDEQSDKIQGFSAGGIDYITKPFQVREVLARVDTHLTVQRLQRSMQEQNTRLQQEIIERKRAEAALQAANDALERRVLERTSELAAANASLNAELAERLRAEAESDRLLVELNTQAQQVREIMNTVPEGLLLLEADRLIVLANPAALGYLKVLASGAQAGQVLGSLGDSPLERLLTSPSQGTFHEVISAGRIFEVLARPVAANGSGQRWVMLIREVTRERETQRQLQQQDRLAAVGQMSAGIAHDFNNILAVILLYSEMALATPGIPPRLLERLKIISLQSRRASELIGQILDFSRRSILERRPMDLLPFLKEQTKLLQRTLPENIRVHLESGPGDYIVEADPTRMQQMIMNLAVNARDVMPNGGNLWIRLGYTPADQPVQCVACGPVRGETWVNLVIQDSGGGIRPADLPFIFEPFFTTKEPGKGTGLGLPQVLGIVKSHQGHIGVESQPGSGSKFSINLPAYRGPQHPPADFDPATLVRGRGQTILLVEDEAATRHALAEGLILINYQVIEAPNGKAALEQVNRARQPIDLVLTDVVMPEMGGVSLARSLLQDGVQAPVILMTGHPIPPEAERDELPNVLQWLPKPPRLKQLSQILSRALQ